MATRARARELSAAVTDTANAGWHPPYLPADDPLLGSIKDVEYFVTLYCLGWQQYKNMCNSITCEFKFSIIFDHI